MDKKLNNKLFEIGKTLNANAKVLTVLRDDYELLQKHIEDIENAIIDARITDNMEVSEQELKAELIQ